MKAQKKAKGFSGRHHSAKTRMQISLAQKGKRRLRQQDRQCALCQSSKTYTRNGWMCWYRHPSIPNGMVCTKCYGKLYRSNKKKKVTASS